MNALWLFLKERTLLVYCTADMEVLLTKDPLWAFNVVIFHWEARL